MLGYDGGGATAAITGFVVRVVNAEGFGPPELLLEVPVTVSVKLAGKGLSAPGM